MGVPILNQGQPINEGQNGPKYQVVRQIPSGSYSHTYVVANTRYPSIEHILKINLTQEDVDPSRVSKVVLENSRVFDRDERTDHEIEMLKGLNHPNIIKISDVVDLEGGYRGILTEPIKDARILREVIKDFREKGNYSYLDFSPDELYERLSEELEANKSLDPVRPEDMPHTIEEVLTRMGSDTYAATFSVFQAFMKTFQQAYEIIDYLREQRISHRDIGPQNILLDSNWNLYLLDFGIAFPFIMPERSRNPEEKQEYDSIAGGVFYRDPLILETGKFPNVGDLWSWGLVFHELLTGKHLITEKPWEDSSRDEMEDFFGKFDSFWHDLTESGPSSYDPDTPLITIPVARNNLERLIFNSFSRVSKSFLTLSKAEWIPFLEEADFVYSTILPSADSDDEWREYVYENSIRGLIDPNGKGKNQALGGVLQRLNFYLSLSMDFLNTIPRIRTQNMHYMKHLSVAAFNRDRY
jgi:serine/threonine protein kinase